MQKDEGEQPSSFHNSEASNGFFCGKDRMTVSAGFSLTGGGSFKGRIKKNPNNSFKIFKFANIKMDFCLHSLPVLLNNDFWWQCNLYARGYFVTGCGSEWQTFHDDIRLFTEHFTKRRLALLRYWLPWIIWIPKQSSEPLCCLCLFINQTLLQPMRKLCT